MKHAPLVAALIFLAIGGFLIFSSKSQNKILEETASYSDIIKISHPLSVYQKGATITVSTTTDSIYRTNLYGFKVEVSPQWNITEGTEKAYVIFYSPDYLTSAGEQGSFIQFSAGPDTGNALDPEAYVTDILAKHPEAKKITLGGQPAALLEMPSQAFSTVEYARNNSYFNIQYQYHLSSEQNSVEWQTFLHTFTFLK